MRIKLTFKAQRLPILYRHRFMALIKEALRLSNEVYKNKLYSDRDSGHTEKAKPFVFSIGLPHFDYASCPVEEFEITVSSNDKSVRPPKVMDKVIPIKPNEYICMHISSSDYEFMVNLYNGLLEMKEFKFNDEIKLSLQKVYMLNEKKINSNEVIFKTLSPILLEEQVVDEETGRKKDRVILAPMKEGGMDEEFNKVFSSIHSGILKDIRGEGCNSLEFTSIKLKKRVIKHTISAYWEKNPDNPVMKFTCFEGCFKLKGDPRDLQMLYQIGIGLRTGQGFGMVDII